MSDSAEVGAGTHVYTSVAWGTHSQLALDILKRGHRQQGWLSKKVFAVFLLLL